MTSLGDIAQVFEAAGLGCFCIRRRSPRWGRAWVVSAEFPETWDEKRRPKSAYWLSTTHVDLETALQQILQVAPKPNPRAALAAIVAETEDLL